MVDDDLEEGGSDPKGEDFFTKRNPNMHSGVNANQVGLEDTKGGDQEMQEVAT